MNYLIQKYVPEYFYRAERQRNGDIRLQLFGKIIPLEIGPGKEMILQKRAFLAAEVSVKLDIHFIQKLGTGIFGGECFFNTLLTGPGMIWLQTMPISGVADTLRALMPNSN